MANLYDVAASVLAVVAVLLALTNIIVEVLKKIVWKNLPTDALAMIVAMVLTLVAFFAWASYANIQILWYYIVAAIMVGFMVAYAAMFGFDKLKAIIERIKDNPTIER